MIDVARINNTLGKMDYYLSTHNSICVSVSGGSDSDIVVHMICKYCRHHLDKIKFVFANTGLEYQATLRHLDELENKYKITIYGVRGVPIPLAVKNNGVPFISKRVSESLSRLQRHGFEFLNVSIEDGINKYGSCKAALRWWCNDWGDKSRFNIDWNKGLKNFLMTEKPAILFSAKCCDLSKKEPMKKFQRDVKADLIITGVRKSEGGTRASAYNDCFKPGKNTSDMYMPLLFWNNDTKQWYKEHENIAYSECYEVWGMKRTGCVGCPFGIKKHEELALLQKYEPNLYKACVAVFGESYRLTDKFNEIRKTENELSGLNQ